MLVADRSHLLAIPAVDRRLLVALAGPALGLLATAVYWWAGPGPAQPDSHLLVAQSLLGGRLWIDGGPYSWLELVPRADGGWYSPYPPLPAIVLAPFVAIGVTSIDSNFATALAGGVSVALMWSLLRDLAVRDRVLLTVGFAFGSELLWVSATAGQALFPQALGCALVLAALVVARDGPPVLAGLLVGLAAAARLPTGLAIVFVTWVTRRPWRVLAGVAVPAVLVGAHNIARFGTPIEFGYGLIVDDAGASVLDEYWYTSGIVSIEYLGRGLERMLLSSFNIVGEPPFVRPDLGGASVLLTMPILAWTVLARGRGVAIAWITVLLVMAPSLMHGAPGFAQFGYRFILDALPLLWLLLAERFRDGIPRLAQVALLAGVAVNAYGLWATSTGFAGY